MFYGFPCDQDEDDPQRYSFNENEYAIDEGRARRRIVDAVRRPFVCRHC